MEEMLSIQKVSAMLGVTVKTLKTWDDENKLKAAFRTAGGHRRYRLTDVEEFIGKAKPNKERVFIYCRVPTKKHDESGNLNKQEEKLLNYCKEKGYEVVDVYKEVASSGDDNRRELTKMFGRLSEIKKIVIEYKGRLAGFGYNYLKEFAHSHDVRIETVEEKDQSEADEEMVSDLVSVVTGLGANIYGIDGGRKLKKTLRELEKERQAENQDI